MPRVPRRWAGSLASAGSWGRQGLQLAQLGREGARPAVGVAAAHRLLPSIDMHAGPRGRNHRGYRSFAVLHGFAAKYGLIARYVRFYHTVRSGASQRPTESPTLNAGVLQAPKSDRRRNEQPAAEREAH